MRTSIASPSRSANSANKFGSFTAGMAFPSMHKLLVEKFGAEFIAPRAERRRGGETIELDVMGYSNGKANISDEEIAFAASWLEQALAPAGGR
jgi:hypothetical protein